MTATIAMDPRIRARRDEVADEQRQRRVRRLVVIGAVVGLVAAALAATRTPLLDVDRIEVAGVSRTPVEAVRAASGIKAGDALTDVDLSAARRSIAALPWVESVTSHRHWNGTVTFTVTEREAVAQVVTGTGQEVALVDADGRVLSTEAEPRSGMVAIVGAEGSVQPGGWLASTALEGLEVAAALPESLAGAVGELSLDQRGRIELVLVEGGQAALGDSLDLNLKFMALATLLDQVDMRCVAEVDVQVPTVPVITRTAAC